MASKVLAKQRAKRHRPRSVLSLYTGAGGLDLGLEAAGFQTRVCIEIDKDCVKTLRHNRSWPVLDRDIHSIPTAELLEVAGLKKGEADLLVGGPPCQPFSKSAYWVSGDTKRLEDPRASTLGEFMRVLEEALPRAFMLENVYGLTYEGKDEGMVFLKDRLSQINKRRRVAYSFTWKVLNAAHYGVPQIRERVFLIGSREGTKFEFPFPTHADTAGQPQRTIFDTPPYRTAWDAIGDLNEADHGDTLKVGGRWAGLLPSIPEGQNYLWHTERGGGSPLFRWRSRYWSMLLKLAKNRPSWTIQAQPGSAIGPFHWKNRRLSMREMCRIQTFPDDYEILGGITSVQKQLGNAVPSAITEMLGLQIRMQLLGDQVRSDELSLVPPVRDHCPAPEPLSRIPTRYRASATLGTSRSAGAA